MASNTKFEQFLHWKPTALGTGSQCAYACPELECA